MKKIIKITETQLQEIIKHSVDEKIVEEGFADSVKNDIKGLKLGNIAKGLKGVWTGQGYDYFRYMNAVRKNIRSLQKTDKNKEKFLQNLVTLKNEIDGTGMDPNKKAEIKKGIDDAIGFYRRYQKVLANIDNVISTKIGK